MYFLKRKTSGPALGLIYGRKAGGDQSYENYTEKLLSSNIAWSKFIINIYIF
jgi:cytochrome c2